MTKSEVFKTAHHVARITVSRVGNYSIAFSIALKNLNDGAKRALPLEKAAEALGVTLTVSYGLVRLFRKDIEIASMSLMPGSWWVHCSESDAYAHSAYEAINFAVNGVVTSTMHISKN